MRKGLPMKENQRKRTNRILLPILLLCLLVVLIGGTSVPVSALEKAPALESGAQNRTASVRETEMPGSREAEGAKKKSQSLTKETWAAFVPVIKGVPKKLKATKKKALRTNAPKGVSVQWSVTNPYSASISKKGVLKGKRVGSVKVKAVFSAVVSGKVRKKTVKTGRITILGKKTIFLDPGHQSYADLNTEPIGPGSAEVKMRVSGGCVGSVTGIPEYWFNLTLAKRLRAALLKKGYGVVMSRTKNNVEISNRERARMANASGADICIRIHADSYADASLRGASVLYAPATNPFPIARHAKKSLWLGTLLLKQFCKATGIQSRGLYARNDLTGFNWSNLPNVLIECGFFSNPEEDVFLNNPANQKKMVKGLVKGIDKYFGY